MSIKSFVVPAAALIMAAPAFAADETSSDSKFSPIVLPHPYIAFDIGRFSVAPDIGKDATVATFGARLGADIIPYLAVEARVGAGITEDTHSYGDFQLDFGLNYYASGFVIGKLPIGDGVSLQALAGVTKIEARAEVAGFSVEYEETDFSYGVGADVRISQSAVLGLEYLRLVSEEVLGYEYHVDTLSIGIKVML